MAILSPQIQDTQYTYFRLANAHVPGVAGFLGLLTQVHWSGSSSKEQPSFFLFFLYFLVLPTSFCSVAVLLGNVFACIIEQSILQMLCFLFLISFLSSTAFFSFSCPRSSSTDSSDSSGISIEPFSYTFTRTHIPSLFPVLFSLPLLGVSFAWLWPPVLAVSGFSSTSKRRMDTRRGVFQSWSLFDIVSYCQKDADAPYYKVKLGNSKTKNIKRINYRPIWIFAHEVVGL